MITELDNNSYLFCCNRKCTTISLDSNKQIITIIDENKNVVQVPYDEMTEICEFFLKQSLVDDVTEFSF